LAGAGAACRGCLRPSSRWGQDTLGGGLAEPNTGPRRPGCVVADERTFDVS